jgi:hypothetical protein
MNRQRAGVLKAVQCGEVKGHSGGDWMPHALWRASYVTLRNLDLVLWSLRTHQNGILEPSTNLGLHCKYGHVQGYVDSWRDRLRRICVPEGWNNSLAWIAIKSMATSSSAMTFQTRETLWLPSRVWGWKRSLSQGQIGQAHIWDGEKLGIRGRNLWHFCWSRSLNQTFYGRGCKESRSCL